MIARRTAVTLALLTAAFFASAVNANANVLVYAPSESPVCGNALVIGVWAQDGTSANGRVRTVHIDITDDTTDTIWFSRVTYARTGDWQEKLLPSGYRGQCGPTTVRYSGRFKSGKRWTQTFHVRFRPEHV